MKLIPCFASSRKSIKLQLYYEKNTYFTHCGNGWYYGNGW